MLYFREHTWILLNARSRFTADIPVDAKTREDVRWDLELEYFAGGPIWRRVRFWERPSVSLIIGNFDGPKRWWTDLERLNFWNLRADDEEEWEFENPGGYLDVFYHGTTDRSKAWSTTESCIWRVAARNGRFFTIELASMVNETALQSAPVVVTPDGTVEEEQLDLDFWRKNAQLYLVENVPFGTVNVAVPRNVREPEAFAIKRAKALVGVEEPEHFEILDHRPREEGQKIETYHGDLHVHLHFNGRYDD